MVMNPIFSIYLLKIGNPIKTVIMMYCLLMLVMITMSGGL